MEKTTDEIMNEAIEVLNTRIRHKRRRKRDPHQKPLFSEVYSDE